MPRNCPKCDEILEVQEHDPSVGIDGCYFCPACDHVEDLDDDSHYLDDCSREN